MKGVRVALRMIGVVALVVGSSVAQSAVIGTSGNDVINFSGTLQSFTTEATSPSGFSVSVNQVMRVNDTQYDGLEGTDVMFATSSADYLNGEDVKNIEVFQFGGGADFADFSSYTQSATYYLSTGNDIFFGSPYDDLVYAGSGDDFVDAGDGFDVIYGGAGNDRIVASLGLNLIYGESGLNTLLFHPEVVFSDFIDIYFLELDTLLPSGHLLFAGTLYGLFHNFDGAESAFYAQDVQSIEFMSSVYGTGEFVRIAQSLPSATVSEPSTIGLLLLTLALVLAKYRGTRSGSNTSYLKGISSSRSYVSPVAQR